MQFFDFRSQSHDLTVNQQDNLPLETFQPRQDTSDNFQRLTISHGSRTLVSPHRQQHRPTTVDLHHQQPDLGISTLAMFHAYIITPAMTSVCFSRTFVSLHQQQYRYTTPAIIQVYITGSGIVLQHQNIVISKLRFNTGNSTSLQQQNIGISTAAIAQAYNSRTFKLAYAD